MKTYFILISFSLIFFEGNTFSQQQLKAEFNKKTSPYTGYTREHWIEITERLLAGLLPHFNQETGMPELKGREGDRGHHNTVDVDPVKLNRTAFERMMIMAATYTKATGKDKVPGYEGSVSKPFITGMTRACNPEDPLYWGRYDYVPQGTSIALSILINPDFFWEPLSEKQKKNILGLLQHLAYSKSHKNNHFLFHMVPVSLVEQHGMDANRKHLTQMLDLIFSFYEGNGWFVDGNTSNQTYDYYNFWGFQMYLNVLYLYDSKWRESYGERIKEVTKELQEFLPYFFGRDGGPIPFGRSQTYRFAANSAISFAYLAGNNSLEPGLLRRIASGNLKYFWEHGCQSPNGLMEIGFRGANSCIAESYIDYGVNYFASTGLTCLLIPEDDPFWTDKEQAIPADNKGGRISIPAAQMILKVNPIDGESRLFSLSKPAAHIMNWQGGAKYSQHAYSSYLGWICTGQNGKDVGAGRTGYSFNNSEWKYRGGADLLRLDENRMVSSYDIFVENKKSPIGKIITHTLISDQGEVHVFWHTAEKTMYLYAAGYGICANDEKDINENKSGESLLVQTQQYNSAIKIISAPKGDLNYEYVEPQQGWLHSHIFDSNGVFPYWKSKDKIKAFEPVVFYVDGTRDRKISIPEIGVEKTGEQMKISVDSKGFVVEIK